MRLIRRFGPFLLLQGPQSPFFGDLATCLAEKRIEVHKINFNGGDRWMSSSARTSDFVGRPEEWSSFLDAYISENGIELILCYGDCRFYHKVAKEVAERRGVGFWVCEEGYLRPDFITLEPHGTGGNSKLPMTQRGLLPESIPLPVPGHLDVIGPTFFTQMLYCSKYHIFYWLDKWRYRRYLKYRSLSTLFDAFAWARSSVRKVKSLISERGVARNLAERHKDLMYIVPLQVSEDAQIRYHSDYKTITDFIREVTGSFAEHAEPDCILVFKHHPMDRGYNNYRRVIERVARQHGVASRVVYGFDLHLPTLLKAARGCVTINSTVGLSALHHGVPTIALGNAIYDVFGLTWQGDLSSFWKGARHVDQALYHRVRSTLFYRTQINGSFYKNRAGTARKVAARLVMSPLEPHNASSTVAQYQREKTDYDLSMPQSAEW